MTNSPVSSNEAHAIPKTLQQRLRDRNVIPFIGAGVSMAVKHRQTNSRLFPSWKALLLAAADRLESENKKPYAGLVRCSLEIDQPDYLMAAEKAREGLGAAWFDFLKEQIDLSSDSAVVESLALARAVWELGSKLIVTTNYDRALRWACPQTADLEEWDIEAAAEHARFLRDGVTKSTVWHLHGQIGNAAKLILTPDGYKRLYPDEQIEARFPAALATLRSSLASYTFLFIGFSLDDEHFGAQLQAVSDVYQGANGPHYVLAKEDQRGRIKEHNPTVEVITFSEFGEPLLELVRKLGALARNDSSTSPAEAQATAIQINTIQPAEKPPYDLDNPVFSVPFPQKGDQVIGREDALQQVRRQLTSGRRTAIGQAASFRGLGGLGKTQLAVEYAYRFRDSYPKGVIWINADQDIDGQLIRLCDAAKWLAPQSESQQKLEVARHRLRSYSDCLIVFDNLELISDIQEYLPEIQAAPHLLITTRHEFAEFPPISLDPLDDDLSVQLLVQEAGREPATAAEQEAARRIAASLGGLPLALELAGAYLRHRSSVSWQQYLDLLQQNFRGALPGKFLSSFTKHEADLYSTLKISDAVFDEEPRLREIIDLLTWSDSALMSIDLIGACLDVGNTVELTNALALGVALRFLQKSPQTESYALHRLVSQVRREESPLANRADWVGNICQRMGDWFQAIREDFTRLIEYESQSDHLRTWQSHSESYGPEQAARLLWLQAYPHYHRVRYREIEELTRRAHELFIKCQSNDAALEAHLLNDWGFARDGLGDYRRALDLRKKALAIRQKLFGDEHPDTARSLNNVGSTYDRLGEFRHALEHEERALGIYQKLFGDEHPDTARSLNNVGVTCGNLGEHRRALEHEKRALAIRQKLHGDEHPDTARSLNDVGSTYDHLGEHRRALEHKERALAIQRGLYGDDHPDTASLLNNVGNTYDHLGEHRRALEHKETALAIRQKLFGDEHPDTANSLNGVGVTYDHLGEFHRALEYEERALGIYQKLFGNEHPDTASSLSNVGGAYARLGEHHRALEHEERALGIYQKLFGDEHPDTANSLNNVGATYDRLGEHRRALEYIERAIGVVRDILGEEHPKTVQFIINKAFTLSNLKRDYEANRLIDEMLKRLPKDHIKYAQLWQTKQKLTQSTPGAHRQKSNNKSKKKRH